MRSFLGDLVWGLEGGEFCTRMNEAFAWLPQSAYAAEAKPLAEQARKKHRGVKRIGDLMIPLLLRLGVSIEEEVESNTSEARSSD